MEVRRRSADYVTAFPVVLGVCFGRRTWRVGSEQVHLETTAMGFTKTYKVTLHLGLLQKQWLVTEPELVTWYSAGIPRAK